MAQDSSSPQSGCWWCNAQYFNLSKCYFILVPVIFNQKKYLLWILCFPVFANKKIGQVVCFCRYIFFGVSIYPKAEVYKLIRYLLQKSSILIGGNGKEQRWFRDFIPLHWNQRKKNFPTIYNTYYVVTNS